MLSFAGSSDSFGLQEFEDHYLCSRGVLFELPGERKQITLLALPSNDKEDGKASEMSSTRAPAVPSLCGREGGLEAVYI